MENGLFPYTRRYLGHLNNHFSTIGIVGMHEAVLNFLGTELSSEEGSRFAGEVLDFMREKLADLQERTGDLFNLEATPAESTSYRLAKHDLQHFPDIITGGDTEAFYTNSSQLAVDHTRDVFEALDHQDPLQTRYTGGTVFHAFLGEAVSDWKACRSMVRAVAHNYRLPYFTISPTFSVCPDHGYLPGEHFTCPRCGAEAEVYSRIVGYYRSVRNWNKGKKEEYGLRQVFTEPTGEFTAALPAEAESADESAGEQTAEPPAGPALTGGPAAEPEVGHETNSGKGPNGAVQLSLLDELPGARAGGSEKYFRTAEADRTSVPLSYLLFYRTHCPNCPPVREFMKSLPLEGREINADTAEGIAEAAAFGVLAAPTVVLFDHEGDEIARGFSADELEVMWSGLQTGFDNPTGPTRGESGGAESGARGPQADKTQAGE